MDTRKYLRIGSAAMLLILILLSGAFLFREAWASEYASDAEYLGMLLNMYPDDEAELVAVFHNKRGSTEQERQRGEAILKKYGYTLDDRISWEKPEGAVLAAGILALGICGEALLFWRAYTENRNMAQRVDFLEEKLLEARAREDQIEKQLRGEEQNTKSLITDISHQLKTPLASLKMSYELADSTPLTKEEAEEFTQKERQEVEKLESLLQVFTQLSQLETGMIRLCPKNTDLKKTLTHSVSSIYMKAMEKQIAIEVREFSGIKIPHDPRWTGEAFLNILDNAVKYSPSGTTVSICVTELVSYVMIEIEDQGIGIPVSEVQDVFKRFYRGNSLEVRAAEGSGVGLYLTRMIIERQSGTVCVKSGKKGGSKFIITLPKKASMGEEQIFFSAL